jgi:elongation of very long chain fatty acids protein 7
VLSNIFIYSYYLQAVSCFKAAILKKIFIIAQIFQYFLIIVHSAQLIFIECDYPKGVLGFICAQSFIFIVLMINFYKKSFPKKDGGYYDYEIQMYRKRI